MFHFSFKLLKKGLDLKKQNNKSEVFPYAQSTKDILANAFQFETHKHRMPPILFLIIIFLNVLETPS